MIPADCIFNLNDHRSKQKKKLLKVYIFKKMQFLCQTRVNDYIFYH